MRTIVPPALRDLVAGWKADGSPSQPGIDWPRQQWIDSFPDHGDLLRRLPDALDRESVRRACTSAATDADAAERAFIAVMAWGYGSVGYGRFRVRRILTATPQADDRLATVARALADDGALAAYGRLARHRDCRLRGLGPAFGTKYLYFTQPQRGEVRALICDQLVADWLDRETNLAITPGTWSVATYRRYLDAMHDWASSLDCRPDDLESLIFQAEATERGSQWGWPSRAPSETAPASGGRSAVAPEHGPTAARNRPAWVSRRLRSGRVTRSSDGGKAMQRSFRTDVYARLVQAAVDGRLVAYSDLLPGDPRHVGSHLYLIADYEKAHHRPPLTAIVVRKQGRRPGEGFATVADQIGYRRSGESDADVWDRACAEVFAYWRP